MGNSNSKSEIENIECEYEMVNTTMLAKLVYIGVEIDKELNSKGNHTLANKMEMMVSRTEINQMIGILSYMNDTNITMKYNLK